MNQKYPTLKQFAAHLVTVMGKVEVVRQPLYDYNLYPTAGSTQPFLFFSVPAGQGISSSSGNAANPKGLADTNMQNAGLLPTPQAFWCDGIQFDFQPGSVATANTYTIQPPVASVAAAAATVQAGENDVSNVLSGGVLSLSISNKIYYQEGPLFRFPPSTSFKLDAAVASNSATAVESLKAKLAARGDPVKIDPGLGIMSTQAFGVQIQFPAAIATPSGFNARMGVMLTGWLFRPVQ